MGDNYIEYQNIPSFKKKWRQHLRGTANQGLTESTRNLEIQLRMATFTRLVR